VLTFLEEIILTSKLTYASKERNGTAQPNYINHYLKSDVSVKLHFQLSYTLVQITSSLKSTSAIVTMKITNIFVANGSHHMPTAPPNFTVNEKQRRTLVSPWRMQWIYRGTYSKRHLSDLLYNCAVALLKSSKTKLVALVIVELH